MGLPRLAAPLLAVAIGQALVIAAQGWVRPPPSERVAQPPPERQFGLFTIPIGCAVIGANLATHAAPTALGGAVGAVVLGWLSTAWLVAREVVPLASRPPEPGAVDGTWFLAPAALLADALGAAAVLPRLPEARAALGWLALTACALGTVGYGVVLALATVRVRRQGLAGTGRAPWWISAGCAGLAAAAIGQVRAVVPVAPVVDVFRWGALLLFTVSCLLLVPVIAGSLRHLARRRRPYGRVVWPPTFSTGVFALGAAQAGMLWPLPVALTVHRIAAPATVALWTVTSLLVLIQARPERDDGRAGGQVFEASAAARSSRSR